MGIAFTRLKNPALAPTDQIMFGKFKGCRVCDIVEDNYEYLIWATKAKLLTLNQESQKLVSKYAGFQEEVRYYEEEVRPYMYDDAGLDFWDTDIPF